MIRTRSLTALGVFTAALGLAAAGPGFAATTHATSAQAGPAVDPGGLFHPAPGAHPNTARTAGSGKTVLDYSTNWSGYAVTGATFTSASASWIQNAASCSSSSGETDMSPWVGLDGYSSSTVEQIGTSADCSGSSVDYYAWYEMYPANYVTINKTIKAGDSFTGTVTRGSGTTYTLKLVNNTEGWTYSVSKSLSAKDSSAEAVMEQAGDHLTKWTGTDPFTNFTVNGSPVGSFTGSAYTIYQMEIQNSVLCDSTSALSGNENFTTSWLNAC